MMSGEWRITEMERYLNTDLTPEERALDLLGRLTVQQKLGQLLCRMFRGNPEEAMADCSCGVGEAIVAARSKSPEETAQHNREVIDAVMEKTGGIPPIIHVEAVTGMVGTGTTSFPTALGLACTFDPDAVEQMSGVIRKQMVSTGIRRALSPVMDVARDPRWGRMGETYGEDPTLAAAMSIAFVKGLQTDDLTEGAAATGKHFLGYAMGEGGYNSGSDSISARDLREIYAKPFQAAITEAKLQTVMNSYGALDNEPVAGSKAIMTRLLREEMKFDGVTVSDYGAISMLEEKRVVEDKKGAAVRAIRAGMDIECPNPEAYALLPEALAEGRITIEQIDKAVFRALTVKFRLGLFENPYPRTELIDEAYGARSNEELSLRLAREATVLLKNDGILPLSAHTGRIAVIGPRGDSVRLQYGGYTFPAGLEMAMGGMLKNMELDMGGESEEYYPNSNVKRESAQVTQIINQAVGKITPTILGAIREKCPSAEISWEKGCDIAGDDRSGMKAAVELASWSDVVILAVGGKYGWGEPCTSGEGRDSTQIGLPGIQEELLQKICETGTPVIVVHGDTRPLSSRYAKEHADAVIETWCPGLTGGRAVADVIFGDYNPAGRLSVTALEHSGQIPMYAAQKRGNIMSLDQHQKGFNSFSNGIQEPLWYFGEGMSYSSFRYENFIVDSQASAEGEIHACVTVENLGPVDGEEVVQLYMTDERAGMLRPVLELAGFARISLKAGEKKKVSFTMKSSQAAFLNEDMQWIVEAGVLTLKVGASSKDIRAEAACNIMDTAVVDGSRRGFLACVMVG